MARLRREPGHRTGRPATTGRPFRRARNSTVARTCLVITRRRVVDMSRMAFSKKTLLDITPELATNSAISLRRAKAAGPVPPNVSWLSGTNRHAPVPIRLYLSRLSESFPLAVAPVSRAPAATAEAANGCVTHMSATIGWPGSSANKSSRSGSRRERGGSWPLCTPGTEFSGELGTPYPPTPTAKGYHLHRRVPKGKPSCRHKTCASTINSCLALAKVPAEMRPQVPSRKSSTLPKCTSSQTALHHVGTSGNC